MGLFSGKDDKKKKEEKEQEEYSFVKIPKNEKKPFNFKLSERRIFLPSFRAQATSGRVTSRDYQEFKKTDNRKHT